MNGTAIESYPIKHVVFGSLNGRQRPHQYFELPVDDKVAKIRYAHSYKPRQGGPSNTIGRTFSRVGLVDKNGFIHANDDRNEYMPIITIPRPQARRVKQYDMMIVQADGVNNGVCTIFVKEDLPDDKQTRRKLRRLSRELYAFL